MEDQDIGIDNPEVKSPAVIAPETREAANAAVEAVLAAGQEEENAALDATEEGAENPAPTPEAKASKAEEKPAGETVASKMAKLIKQREEKFRIRNEAKEEAQSAFQKELSELRALRQELERDKQEVAQGKQLLNLLREKPVEAFRQAGIDPEAFVSDVVKDGTPEGRMEQYIRRQDAELRQLRELVQQRFQSDEERQKQYLSRQEEERRSGIVKAYLAEAKEEEKYPHLNAAFGGNDELLVAMGHKVADLYRSVTGKQPTWSQIAEYIEEDISGRVSKLTEKASGKKAVAGATGKASRSLNSAMASERKSVEVPVKGASWEDRKKAAAKAAAEAIMGAED